MGQLAIESHAKGAFVLKHHEDIGRDHLASHCTVEDAMKLARFDDAGNYRPLKTAPTLRHGWELRVENLAELRCALDQFYPGRLAVFFAFETGDLETTHLRDTLERQSGMYRIAAQVRDDQLVELARNFCRSDGGCLERFSAARSKRNSAFGKLPPQKFEPTHNQTGGQPPVIPLLCQEGCNCSWPPREVVQAGQ